jgi:Ca-activated chloride channel homolog
MRCWWLVPMVLSVFTAPLHAQGWIDPVRPVRDFGVHKLRSAVTVRVEGRVARVEVEEWFRNDGGALGEGDYLYPLPGEAVFSNFSLYQGDQELRGETMDSRQARSIYEEIVRAKKDPALIELAGHGLMRARVFPIAAGETRKITLRYTQLLPRTGDALQFKYAAGMPIDKRRDAVPLSFSLVIENGATFGRPFSPTHDVHVQQSGSRITVRPDTELSGDFDVFLPLRAASVGLTMITHKPSSEPGFFMLTLSPSRMREERSTPRDVTVVVDVSGSMSGEKIEQARSAMHALLRSLGDADRFRLIAFSDQVRNYRTGWLPANRTTVAGADEWIDDLRAEGGTNISGALEEAFRASSPEGRLPFVIFVTDGLPSVGEQNPERIAARAEGRRGRARVFAFGVGYDVNTYLLDRLSAAARGSTQYVKPGESVERPLAVLATRIRFPVLTDLSIGNTAARIEEIYPVELPDLFADEELVIVGRYRGAGRGNVSVTGQRGGRTEVFSTRAQFANHSLDNDYIPKIWASRKVGYLAQRIKLNGHNKELVDQLRDTALRYGILSEYTSYLVQEPVAGQLAARNQNGPPVVAPSAQVGSTAGRPMVPRDQVASKNIATSGQGAVVAAEAMRRQREAKTSSAVDLAAAEAREEDAQDTNIRTIAGRTFRNLSGMWTDAAYRSGRGDVVTIEPFSTAYFALLQELPELEPYWKAFDQVVVNGRSTSIKLQAGGAKQLDATRMAAIVKEFRN